MNDQKEAIEIIMMGRSYVYQLFHNIFGNEPNKEQLALISNDDTMDVLEVFHMGEDSFIARWQTFMKELHNHQDMDSWIDQLKGEYTRLFIGPAKLPAPPWESVYVGKERLLFQESTLKVRNWYRKYHVLPSDYPHVADDHLALEMDFMGRLCDLCLKAVESSERDKIQSILSDQKEFLTQHLLKWIPKFREQIMASETKLMYPAIAEYLELFLKLDLELIDELMENI